MAAGDRETKEKDPVEALRASLKKALSTLTGLIKGEDKELQEELREIESGVTSQSGQVEQSSQNKDTNTNSNLPTKV